MRSLTVSIVGVSYYLEFKQSCYKIKYQIEKNVLSNTKLLDQVQIYVHGNLYYGDMRYISIQKNIKTKYF